MSSNGIPASLRCVLSTGVPPTSSEVAVGLNIPITEARRQLVELVEAGELEALVAEGERVVYQLADREPDDIAELTPRHYVRAKHLVRQIELDAFGPADLCEQFEGDGERCSLQQAGQMLEQLATDGKLTWVSRTTYAIARRSRLLKAYNGQPRSGMLAVGTVGFAVGTLLRLADDLIDHVENLAAGTVA